MFVFPRVAPKVLKNGGGGDGKQNIFVIKPKIFPTPWAQYQLELGAMLLVPACQHSTSRYAVSFFQLRNLPYLWSYES